MGAKKGWHFFVDEWVRPVPGMHVLDIGCGPADILEFLPEVDYWGFDISQKYIQYASERHPHKGHFYCKLLRMEDLEQLPKFDVVIASGVLHHMDNDTAKTLFQLAHAALRPGARLVTVDPCWSKGQHPIARLLIACDRGQNVRTEKEYDDLAAPLFPQRKTIVHHKSWIPYTHCYMECERA